MSSSSAGQQVRTDDKLLVILVFWLGSPCQQPCHPTIPHTQAHATPITPRSGCARTSCRYPTGASIQRKASNAISTTAQDVSTPSRHTFSICGASTHHPPIPPRRSPKGLLSIAICSNSASGFVTLTTKPSHPSSHALPARAAFTHYSTRIATTVDPSTHRSSAPSTLSSSTQNHSRTATAHPRPQLRRPHRVDWCPQAGLGCPQNQI